MQASFGASDKPFTSQFDQCHDFSADIATEDGFVGVIEFH
jgi:hypothetical protein